MYSVNFYFDNLYMVPNINNLNIVFKEKYYTQGTTTVPIKTHHDNIIIMFFILFLKCLETYVRYLCLKQHGLY